MLSKIYYCTLTLSVLFIYTNLTFSNQTDTLTTITSDNNFLYLLYTIQTFISDYTLKALLIFSKLTYSGDCVLCFSSYFLNLHCYLVLFHGQTGFVYACVTGVLWFVSSAARTVSEAAPTWLSPTGSSSSILVLQGEELLLECIASGV